MSTTLQILKSAGVLALLVCISIAITGATASAQVVPPTITKSFADSAIPLGGTTTLDVTVKGAAGNGLVTGISFTDVLPAGLVFDVQTSGNFCGGTYSFTLTTFTATGWQLDGSSSCGFVGFVVRGTTPGVKVNTTSAVTSNEATPGAPATATVTVFAPPDISKAFGAVAVPIGGTTALTFAVSNPNSIPLTGINFIDTLPAGLLVAAPNGFTGGCGAGAVFTATPGTAVISLADGNVGPQGTCRFSVRVAGVAEGMQLNTTGPVGSAEGGAGLPASASLFVGAAFQVSYAANLNPGESNINITNNGVNGAPLLGPGFGPQAGNICVNVYAFAPDEQMISCCSCLVTANGLVNIGAVRDLTANTLTGILPTSIVVKTVTTLANQNGSGTNCSNSAAAISPAAIVGGALAWRTTLHEAPSSGYDTTEVPFSPATLSMGELQSLGGRCAAIIGNGSGYGICRSCRSGGLGADRM